MTMIAEELTSSSHEIVHLTLRAKVLHYDDFPLTPLYDGTTNAPSVVEFAP